MIHFILTNTWVWAKIAFILLVLQCIGILVHLPEADTGDGKCHGGAWILYVGIAGVFFFGLTVAGVIHKIWTYFQ